MAVRGHAPVLNLAELQKVTYLNLLSLGQLLGWGRWRRPLTRRSRVAETRLFLAVMASAREVL